MAVVDLKKKAIRNRILSSSYYSTFGLKPTSQQLKKYVLHYIVRIWIVWTCYILYYILHFLNTMTSDIPLFWCRPTVFHILYVKEKSRMCPLSKNVDKVEYSNSEGNKSPDYLFPATFRIWRFFLHLKMILYSKMWLRSNCVEYVSVLKG